MKIRALLATFFSLAVVPLLAAEEAPPTALGQQTYQLCVACHGLDGKGMKAGDLLMAPSLPESAFIRGGHADLIGAIVLKGIAKQDNRYVQAMLPLENALSDEQLAAVVNYVLDEYGKEKPKRSTARDAAKWRKTFASQQSPYRRADLEQILQLADSPTLLRNLRYRFYEGKWEELPDFSQLDPSRSGALPDGRISLAPARDHRKPFGMVFEADFTVPKTADYHFTLGSDDGSALVIDGEGILDNDGIHPAQSKRIKEHIEAGEHTLKVLYFDGGGQRALGLSVRGPDIGTVLLSEAPPVKQKGKQSYDPIPLKPRSPGEAIVHRAFLPDAGPRAIAVGYPGGVNLAWDAGTLNLAYLWRGEFMDAAPHWNGRGSGSKPLGRDRLKPLPPSYPLQVLSSPDEPWEPLRQGRIAYERDTADPTKEITFDLEHPDYQFAGYRLDENRFPTFRYRYRDIDVTDTFVPAIEAGIEGTVRTLTLTGNPPGGLHLRIAQVDGLDETAPGVFSAGKEMTISAEGAAIRRGEGKPELLLPVTGPGAVSVTYRWTRPMPAE